LTEGERTDFYFHLEELRFTIIRSLIYLVIAVVVTFSFWQDLAALLMLPVKHLLDSGLLLVTNQPAEALTLAIQLSLIGGLVVAAPAILVELWAFVAPGLLPGERRYVAYALPVAFILFVLGVAFAYLVLPVGMRFLYSFSTGANLKPLWSITSYLRFLLWSCVAVGIVFELPLVTGVLSMLGIVSSRFLVTKRRHAIIVILLLAAIITPSVDFITMLVVTLPIIVLYEVSILVSKRVEGLRRRREAGGRGGTAPGH